MEIKIYNKLPDDAEMIRKKVFMEEQGFKNEFDDWDSISTHIVIYEEDKPIATCRIYLSEKRNCYILGRIAVISEFRGRDYGSMLLKAAEDSISDLGGGIIELLAQVRASIFYAKNGYDSLEEYVDDEGCPHVWMRKEIR